MKREHSLIVSHPKTNGKQAVRTYWCCSL